MDSAHLLVVEPDPASLEAALAPLRREAHAIRVVPTATAALEALASDYYEAVLLNLDLPDQPGLKLLERIAAETAPPEVIVVTSQGSIATAVEAMKKGAYDFLMKPVAPERLRVTVKNALEHRRLQGTLTTLQPAYGEGAHGFIGLSPAMQAVYRMIESAAASKATVFVTGESGTGKDVCAAAIHQASPRAKEPFIALNCAAIPKDLIESEVFGHVKGAFTGATADRAGAATQADGGTLFLDEICEMSADLQSKMLRFLQSGTFQRVGGTGTEKVDVRILAATNKDPWAEVEAGRFREDLYYRLHVIPISLPPLRERSEDVLLLARHFLLQYAAEEKKKFEGFTVEAERVMMNYDWPGNVRQLQNIVRNIVVLNDAERVTPEMIPPPAGGRWARADMTKGSAAPVAATPAAIRPLAVVEREAIEGAIAACGGNVPKAAAMLGVSPSTLYRKRESWSKNEPDVA